METTIRRSLNSVLEQADQLSVDLMGAKMNDHLRNFLEDVIDERFEGYELWLEEISEFVSPLLVAYQAWKVYQVGWDYKFDDIYDKSSIIFHQAIDQAETVWKSSHITLNPEDRI